MDSLSKRVRKRVETMIDSPAISGPICRVISRNLRARADNIEWSYEGRDALAAEVQSGQAVIMVLWHGRLPAAPIGWDTNWGKLCVVTSAAPPGKMVGRVMQQFGHDTIRMRDRKANRAAVMQVARMARGRTSIGFAADGPLGPARKAKSVPIDWARLTGAPIWLYSASYERFRCIEKSWDRMAMPVSGGRGIMLYERWDAEIPKRMDADCREKLRLKLEDDLNALTLRADQRVGHSGLIN
ncbi:lysophospholipid acyltransferase family protein [Tropicimonas marinistellae]|uniref:lysophospholipid acyltransferase family protein n=1 Tax=Tropicimonas marinistellae TaxID=1739787 RepID=UPI000832418E|nr:DUF374 domain-containing protein [Tropicimonas marinistellae]